MAQVDGSAVQGRAGARSGTAAAPGSSAVPQPVPVAVDARRGGYPLGLWVLVGGYGLCRAGAALPYLALYLSARRHLDAQQIASVLAAFGGGYLVGQPLAGWAADRIGRRPAIVASLSATAAVYLAMPRTASPALLLVEAALVGVCADGPRPAVNAWLADLAPADRLGRAAGLLYWATNIGAAVAGALGAVLASRAPGALFLADAATGVAFAALTFAVPTPARTGQRTPHRGASGWRAVLADRRLLAITGVTWAWLLLFQQATYGIPLAMRAEHLPLGAVGVVNVVNAAVAVAVQPLLQRWVLDRVPPLLLCAAGSVLMGAGMAANAAAHSTVAYTAACALWTPSEALFLCSASAYVTRRGRGGSLGRYLGTWSTALGASALAAPLLSAPLLRAGPATLWTSCGALGAACALICLFLSRTEGPAR